MGAVVIILDSSVGVVVGAVVGLLKGAEDGLPVGAPVGLLDDLLVGPNVGSLVGLLCGTTGALVTLYRALPKPSPQYSPVLHRRALQSQFGLPQPFLAQSPHRPYCVVAVTSFEAQHSPPDCSAAYM